MFSFGEKTYIMGILNVTPDSFSDGGEYTNIEIAIKHSEEMIKQGADIIDIGGESTRPGSEFVDEKEEIKRVVPVVKKLINTIDVPISVDTYKSSVASEVLQLGVPMINDVWGLQKDELMADVIAKHDAYIVIMHNQDGTEYDEDIILSIKKFLNKSIQIAKKLV